MKLSTVLCAICYSGGRTVDALVDFVNNEAGEEHLVLKNMPVYLRKVTAAPSEVVVYEKVAAAYKAEKDVVVADAHSGLGERYGVTGYPTLKFFPKNNKDGEDYDADRTLAAFVDFLNEKVGTSRTTTGTLNDDAGKVSSLDEILPDFLSAKPEQQSDILKKVEEEAFKLEGADAGYGEVHLKVLKSMIEKGEGYAKKEADRLS
ncbi:unnamed protein product [Sphagnum troendelagicum]|uniref:protein disulfide-isomerase n=1 Tax=Sphagnum troendelagicum TaxID=128251 RepID=A0ABP0UFF9_9BRYO